MIQILLKKVRGLYLAIFLLSICKINPVHSQFSVTTGQTAQQLAERLAGPNIQVFNASYVGALSQRGVYTYTGNALQTNSGVVLSTGMAGGIGGPNNSGSSSTFSGSPGDPTLTAIAGYNTYDAAGIKFDFEVQSNSISFDFIFGSEEYNEFVGTNFNDVFAFFISGPGISGEQNLAVVPTTTSPVTINTINLNSYWQFYRNNELGVYTNHTQMDGFTIKMSAIKEGLIPCETYTLRLVIADGSDSVYDSMVLLEENSLVQSTIDIVSTTPSTDDTALEGCIKASFTFSIDQPLPQDFTIPFEIAGTAINGVDYGAIENFVTIPSGQLSATVFIDAYEDGIAEGQETVELIYSQTPCSPKDTIRLFINDMVPIDFTITGSNLNCFGDYSGEIDMDISGGTAPYYIEVATSGYETYTLSSSELPITGLSAGIYYISVNDAYGCNGESIASNGEYDGGTIFLPDGNGQVYSTVINISGFDGAVITSPEQIQAICVNMEHSALGDVEIRLIAPNGTELILKQRFNNSDGGHTDLGEPVASGPVDGGNQDITPGIGYDYCFTHDPYYGTMVQERNNYNRTYVDVTGHTLTDNYLPAGSYRPYQELTSLVGVPIDGNWTLWIKDHKPQDNGYIFNWSINMIAPSSGDSIILTQPNDLSVVLNASSPDCGQDNGSIDITVNGEFTPFTYLWSTGATSEDLIDVTAGVYTVEITDNNGCIKDTVFALSNSFGPSISAEITNETCLGSNNGSINLSIVGEIQSIVWSNGATTEDLTGLAPGTYSVNVTTVDACISSATYTILPATALMLNANLTNEGCGNYNGGIDLTVNGGTMPFDYLWSNGATTQDIYDLQQGTYSVTVYDDLGCMAQGSYSIINEVGNCTPNCDLSIDHSMITDEYCGNGAGAIQVNAVSSNSPILVSWSSGQTSMNISSLSAGQYTLSLSDALGCELTQVYTVLNNTYGLAMSNLVVTNEVCGNSSGGISYTVSGGTAPYLFEWSNGASSQNLTNLSEGQYSITITDQTGCSLSNTVSVSNTAPHSLSFQYVMHETCGNSAGSIDINVSPLANYSYLWNTGATTQDLLNLSAGEYSCVITNTSTGCSITTPTYTVLNQSNGLTASVIRVDDEVCGDGNGKILINVTGGTPGYTYAWSNGATSSSISDLSQGIYSVTITDALGCTTSLTNIQVLNVPGDLVATAFVLPDTCSTSVGSIELSITGGASPFSFAWSNAATTQNLNNLLSGSYSYTVTDASGCVFSGSQFVQNVSGGLTANAIVVQPDCGVANGSIDLSVFNNAGAVTYTWSNGSTSQDLNNLTGGNYQVIITDIDGCTLTQTFSLVGNLVASETIVPEDCGYNNGSILLSVSGGSGYQFLWSNGSTSNTISLLGSDTYSVNVTSFEGCGFNGSFFVPENLNCILMCSQSSTNLPSGRLFDSGGPLGNYSNNENCSFLIAPFCADTVKLQFTNFQTQPSADIVRIYDGENTSGILLATLSSSISYNTIYKAASGKMFITFNSSATNVFSGFAANWSTVQHSSEPVASFSASNTNPAIGQEVVFTNTSFYGDQFQWDLNGDGIDDYTTLNAASTYSTPGIYLVRLIATNCHNSDTSTIEINVQGAPEIEVVGIWTDTISNCSETISFSGTMSNVGEGDLIWSASHPSYTVVPSSGTLAPGQSISITITNPSYNSAGTYNTNLILNSNDPENSSISTELTVVQLITCFFTMCVESSTDYSSGVLYDSGGPSGNYANNQNCSFLIAPPCADTVKFQFTSFLTQTTFDVVRIYDGENASGTLLATLSGTISGGTVYSAPSGKMFITFVSNGSTVYSGFAGNWTTINHALPPIADISTSNDNPALGENVTFSSSTTNVITYDWDVDGDGVTDYTTPNITHAFTSPGTYEIQLIASNCLGSDTSSILVTVQEAPVLDFVGIWTDTISDCLETIRFEGTITNNGNGDLLWSASHPNFTVIPASGTLAPGQSIDIAITGPYYSSIGTFNSVLTLSTNDPDNSTITTTLTVVQEVICVHTMCAQTNSTNPNGILFDSGGDLGNYLNNQNCSFLIAPPCADTVNLQFTHFSTQVTNDVVRIYDGENATGILLATLSGTPSLSTIYKAASGRMFITFTSNSSVVSSGFAANWTTINHELPPIADISTSNVNPALGQNVTFSSSTTNVITYSWDVDGDGVTDYTTPNITHVYTSPGVYVAQLIVGNCIGSDTSSIIITVQDAPLIELVGIWTDTISNCLETISFDGTITNNGNGDLLWSASHPDFTVSPSSGTLAPGQSIDILITGPYYSSLGTFNSILTLSSNDPNNGTISTPLTVVQEIICAYSLCSFTSSNNPIGSLYDSGGPNGNYANNQNCTFLIAPPCADTVKLQFSAFQLESNYDFVRIYDGEDATGILLATLTGNASLSTIYRAASGKMFIRFTSDVSIVMSGIAAHWTTVIHDNLPVASFTSSDLEIAFGQNITFTNTSSYGDEYFWDVDGDGVDDYTSPNVTHTYTTPGVHTVRLITTNCNGSDTTSMLITVQEAPVLDFVGIWTDTITSCDDSFSFSGTITNNGSGDLLWSATHPSYTITPSSGVLEPGQSTSILISAPIYNSAGTYETTLTLNTNDPDNNSVSTTMTAVQEVSCIFSMCLNSSTDSPSGTLYDSGGPTGNYANNQNCSFLIAPACADTIKFQFTSFQTQVTYDVVRIYDGENASGTLLATLSGTISLGTVYSAPSGKMFITFVTNGSTIFSGFAGNWTTITQTQAPSAAFVASNDFPDYAEAVSFTSQTSVADEYFWDIDGDGITDYTSANVTHSYTTAGTYTVQLITSNCLGSDTSSMEIVVKNPPSIQLIGTWTDTIYNCQEMISFSGTIINNGPSDLTWSTSHPSFSIVPSSGVLGEGQSVNIVITGLAYGAAGTYNSLLTVTSNDPLNGIIETNLSVVQLLTCNLLMCVNGSSNLPIGTLYDSGGPSGNYSDNQNCTFLIAPPCADTVKLHFSAFQLENNFDFVRIYDGEDATGILLATLTGNASLSPIYSAASGKMFIRFTSDVSVVMSGFTAHWKTIELFAPPQADFDYTGDLLTNSAIDFSLVTFSDNLTYDWSFGDGTSSTDPNPSHIYLEEGTYVVTLIVTDECGRTDEVSMNLIIDVNSLIHVLEAGLQIYPNPSRTGLFTLKGFSESVSAIEITDQTGRIVPYTLNPMDNSVYQIDISHEAPGVYYLKYGNRVYKLIK